MTDTIPTLLPVPLSPTTAACVDIIRASLARNGHAAVHHIVAAQSGRLALSLASGEIGLEVFSLEVRALIVAAGW
jgi:hypothetical protein